MSMGDKSTQSNMVKSLGGYGSERVVGADTVTGNYIAVQAIADTTILGDTVGNMENIDGLVVSEGIIILGDWSVLQVSGECIIYNG